MVRFNGPKRHYGSASLERSREVVQNRAAMRNESAVLRYYAKSKDPYQGETQYPRGKGIMVKENHSAQREED